MSKEGNFSGKIAMAKKRIANALTEYAINWNNLQGSLDREDLNGFLKIWKEEFDALKKPVSLETQLFQLANLLSNLEIQQDMLRSGKNWKKLTEDQDMDTTVPPELAAIKNTIDTIPTE